MPAGKVHVSGPLTKEVVLPPVTAVFKVFVTLIARLFVPLSKIPEFVPSVNASIPVTNVVAELVELSITVWALAIVRLFIDVGRSVV